MNAKKRKTGKVIVYVLILLILVGVVGFFAYFTNGFTGDLKTFYVECDGHKVMSSTSGFILKSDTPLDVSVHYTFGFFNKEISGYSVTVLPIQDFDFTVNGETYSFAAEGDFTECFNIEKQESSFTIAPKGTLRNMLELKHPESEVDYNIPDVDFESELFKVIVTAEDGSAFVELLCILDDTGIIGVFLDQEVIVF